MNVRWTLKQRRVLPENISNIYKKNTNLFFQSIEIINDDWNEKIKNEKCSNNDENNKVEVGCKIVPFDWLLVHLERWIKLQVIT